MLYIFCGSDIPKSVERSRTLIASLQAKKPDAASVRIEADAWDPAAVEEHLGGQGLFSSRYIVVLDRVAEDADAREQLADLLPAMKESENIFIVLEGKPNAELTRAFEKDADKIVVSDEKKSSDAGAGKPEFNIFALTGSLGSLSSLKSWAMYRQAVDSGMSTEQLIGVLFWWAKSHDMAMAKSLLEIYHDSHRGLIDGELGVERLLLNCGK